MTETKTLRDEFAMAALSGILAVKNTDMDISVCAGDAYEMADRMLVERAKVERPSRHPRSDFEDAMAKRAEDVRLRPKDVLDSETHLTEVYALNEWFEDVLVPRVQRKYGEHICRFVRREVVELRRLLSLAEMERNKARGALDLIAKQIDVRRDWRPLSKPQMDNLHRLIAEGLGE